MIFRCYYCGDLKDDSLSSLEHIIPDSCGGTITTQQVCKECNHRANREIDQHFKEDQFVAQARAFLGIKDKHGREAVSKIYGVTKGGEKLELVTRKGEAFVPIIATEVNWETKRMKVHPSRYDEALPNVLKKAQKKGYVGIEFPTSPPQIQSEPTGVVELGISINLGVIRREQCKIMLGMGSLLLPGFVSSRTAQRLRTLMWGTEQDVGLRGHLDPFNHYQGFSPWIQDGLTIRVIPADTREMEYISFHHKHTVAIYPYQGFVRIYVNLFGMCESFVDTLEPDFQYWPGPCAAPRGVGFIIDPALGTTTSDEIPQLLGKVGPLEAARTMGFIASHPAFSNIRWV